MEHPIAEMFLAQYRGPADADHVAASWYRQVLKPGGLRSQPPAHRQPPADVTQRLEERERDARLQRYCRALEEETENAPD